MDSRLSKKVVWLYKHLQKEFQENWCPPSLEREMNSPGQGASSVCIYYCKSLGSVLN